MTFNAIVLFLVAPLFGIALVHGFAVELVLGRRRRATMAALRQRRDSLEHWRAAFPSAREGELRDFLRQLDLDFSMGRRTRRRILPTDTVVGVYRMRNPPGTMGDALEVESLMMSLSERGVEFGAEQVDETLTFGQIFGWLAARRETP